MFSGFDEEPLALRALELGATSYLTKTSSLDAVVAELVGAAEGADEQTDEQQRAGPAPAEAVAGPGSR